MDHLQAIVLDFDGVIADTEPLHYEACREVLAPFGVRLTAAEYVEHYIGVADRNALAGMGRAHGFEIDSHLMDTLVARKAEVLRHVLGASWLVYPGVAELIRSWAAYVPIGIASGALRSEIDLVLGAAGLDGTIRAVVSGDAGVRSKPAPDPYLRALDLLARQQDDLVPARCVAVEDSRWGIHSAREAGMRTVAVTTSLPSTALQEADLVVTSLTELTLAVLDALCA